MPRAGLACEIFRTELTRFSTRLERVKRPPSRRERYHLVEALQHLYEGRSEDDVEAALDWAERIEPLPSHLTAQLIPSDSVTVQKSSRGIERSSLKAKRELSSN